MIYHSCYVHTYGLPAGLLPLSSSLGWPSVCVCARAGVCFPGLCDSRPIFLCFLVEVVSDDAVSTVTPSSCSISTIKVLSSVFLRLWSVLVSLHIAEILPRTVAMAMRRDSLTSHLPGSVAMATRNQVKGVFVTVPGLKTLQCFLSHRLAAVDLFRVEFGLSGQKDLRR